MLAIKALVIILPVIVIANPFFDVVQEMSCCSLAAGSCRSVCSKIPLVTLGADREARENATSRFLEFCSAELIDFWSCVNSTLEEVKKNENWTGRRCCHLAQNPICQSTCALSGSRSNLSESCRLSDEPELISCLERREEAERCCSTVSNDTCRSVCKDLFHKPGKRSSLKLYSSKGCFHQIPKCLKSVAEVKRVDDPKQYLHCCDEATNAACSDTCRKILQTATTDQEILDALAEKCSPILPHSPLWSCVLKSTPTKPIRLPLDTGKLSCCSRATRQRCQNLCWRAFQADWETAWSQLDSECLSSNLDSELRRCLDETDNSCEMGCSGLSYCARFNDRPTTLFRTCTAAADDAAKWEADHWSHGGIIRGLGVAVQVASSCPPETLRAAACLLQLRPCEARIHETRLCREDCLELMASCVDWSTITGSHTAATLCSKLSPGRPDAPCVSLKPFLENPRDDNSVVNPQDDITTPCKNNPCPQGQICLLTVNERETHRCVPGCTLGEISKQVVPLFSWVQIPRYDQHGCLRICQCTLQGLEKCKTLNCINFEFCWVQDRFIPPRLNFYLECNLCRCFEGEVTCSRKSCTEIKIPSLPCDCPAHYVPVCGKSGYTFASACLAKCAGFTANEVDFGRCSSRDPCSPNPCNVTDKCVRRRRVCLTSIHKFCKQYECVPIDCNPREETSGPVCDKDNRQHHSICAMIRAGASLGYRSPCLKSCSLRGPVCGIDGEIYINECAAWAEKTVVDYYGPCVTVGLISDQAKPRCGDIVQCPPLKEANCIGVTPPGACCPVCGGAARLYYSKKQLDKIYHVMDEEIDKDFVTLDALLSALRRQVQVAQCAVRGMVTLEGDIFVVVQSVLEKPSSLQLRACVAEMEKLVVRITERSSKIAAEVPLGSLTRAELAHNHISSANVNRVWFPIISCTIIFSIFT
ncbi:PREDICTED: reversion-inducing cysteine-rich protein with Kazal motifs isoform X1 [Polistes canadensis]|uniref:reversion-inducing cysteine-rich protein with Kazal motifs isoform X1 n=2 Tax=Polistes canadensis TaxID=91411 RepID=UPI000718CCFF|nr:PREDICTED: reversion-inducing cysteine-rich protein with Kazal motifs isoform X1 [Polistes canadensis]